MQEHFSRHSIDEHSLMVSKIASILAKKMGYTADQVRTIKEGALLHDVGKKYISNSILDKKSGLSPQEYAIIQCHPKLGCQDILERIRVLLNAAIITLQHHERIDGAGYPNGTTDIDVGAKIVAVADVYDALMSNRPYKKAWPHDKTLQYMIQNAGTQFDADIICVLLESIDEILSLFSKGQEGR